MALPIVNVPVNPAVEIKMLDAPVPNATDLVYKGGGGSILANLKDDLVQGGYLYHGGNPLINLDYAVKGCTNMSVNSIPVKTESNAVDKGLIYYNAASNKYYWSEVYTTPLGYYKAVGGTPNANNFEFSTSSPIATPGNQLIVSIKDMNVQPKVGDYIVIQKVSDSIPNSNDSYTDDIESFPVDVNSELYQFKITQVLIDSGSGTAVLFRLYLDKSISLIQNGSYSLVLLNRENTGIQKELFYDTFEQIEIHRNQLLGDPYNNINNFALPMGRKNYLNYNGSSYLGLATLLKNIIVDEKTPFIVFDLNDEIRDRFKVQENSLEFLLPFVMSQDDSRIGTAINAPNKLINSGSNQFEENGVGNYCGLYFNWDLNKVKRVGWVFYDLRIVVIDDSELATALGYNSNRNYTLPAGQLLAGVGNDIQNPGGGVELAIDNLEVINNNQVVVKTSALHNLLNGTQVFIYNAYVLNSNNNIIPASANGTRYVKLLNPNDPYKFQIFADAALTIPIVTNGTYTLNNGVAGNVKGTLPKYKYFYTYRLIGKHYKSILPYSKTTDFNFAKNGAVDNISTDAQLNIALPKIKWLVDSVNLKGFEADDLEIIIGTYLNDDPVNPQKITGIGDVVVIPITELINSRSLKTGGVQTDFSNFNNSIKIFKQDLDVFISKIGGSGAYNKATNPNGDPSYNILNNYNHYTYTNGDPVPADLVVGKGKWTLGNIKFRAQAEQYRSTIQVIVPAEKWNDTTNPTYDPTNPFIKDRYISEIAIVLQDVNTKTEKPMIYAKIAPAIKKTSDLDILINLTLDW